MARRKETTNAVAESKVEQIPVPVEDNPVKEATPEKSASEVIFSKKRGPNLEVKLHLANEKTKFWLLRGKERSNLELPLAVKVAKEGGLGYRLELYYNLSSAPLSLEKFDNLDLFIQDVENSPAGQLVGVKYGPLVGVASIYGKLEEFEGVRLQKYVCATEVPTVVTGKDRRQVFPWEAVPFNAKTLGAIIS
jgi:hypothetical protein